MLGIIQKIIKKNFRVQWDQIVNVEPLLWSHFVPTIHPEGDTSRKPLSNVYCELTNREKLQEIA